MQVHTNYDFNLGNYGTGKTVLATEGSKIKLARYDEMRMHSEEPEKLPEKIQVIIFNLGKIIHTLNLFLSETQLNLTSAVS